MTDHAMHNILALLAQKKNLPRDMAVRAFQIIMNGGATPAQMGGFLMALHTKGETFDELAAGVLAMRAKAQRVNVPAGAIDTCGTGGDGKSTYNISTAVAFVMAAAGVPVAKHGNRSVSSRSGSADVLSMLGIKIDVDAKQAEHCLAECGICFMMAPKFHPAMRHVAPVRQELGFRTIFNLIGPPANPAQPDFHLMGIYSKDWTEPMARALKELGCKGAWVVHGSDGLDELTLTGPTHVSELKDGTIRSFEITPEDAGLERIHSIADLQGSTPEQNASALLEALSGLESTYRQSILYNAAAGFIVTQKASTLREGVAIAANAIDSGKAHALIKKLGIVSNKT